MSTSKNEVAVVGLGVMGANLARNLARSGYRVGGYDRRDGIQQELEALEPTGAFDISGSLSAMVQSLETPRRIIVLVPAQVVDDVIADLSPLLDRDDILVDAGNSLYELTNARHERATSEPWRFVGMGVSGGAEGALRGPSMMPGGDEEAWERLRPVLESIAANSESGPCVTHCGNGSAGHFVKMTHNGIEYGDMELLAETSQLLRRGLGFSPDALGRLLSDWNQGELASFLLEITADIFRTPDPETPDGFLVDAILDKAGQKGTGRWTVVAAVKLGVPVPTIAAAVDARAISSFRNTRLEVAQAVFDEGSTAAFEERVLSKNGVLPSLSTELIHDALLLAKFTSYAQGFDMLRVASDEYGYEINLAEVARIWTGGCIIRAQLLRPIRDALMEDPNRRLILAPGFVEMIRRTLPALRLVVMAATEAGFAVPGLSAALAWIESFGASRSTANVIQAQRDYFGSHTYRRRDRPEQPVHTEWPRFNDIDASSTS